ncbi:MAG: hypothetical protein M3452_05495, partial [Chloroflexota bacterium]|nr:hypothetical protein [Chloroflexota bacterium]
MTPCRVIRLRAGLLAAAALLLIGAPVAAHADLERSESEPQDAWLSTTTAWSIQLAAVVGGHVVGAWAGHSVAQGMSRVHGRLGQLPLALVMVALTAATLWSLGQDLVFVEDREVVEG